MRTSQWMWSNPSGWSLKQGEGISEANTLVLAFGDVDEIGNDARYTELQELFPGATVIMSSTAGEILDEEVKDNSIVATAMHFEKTNLKLAEVNVSECADSFECGKAIADQLEHEGLRHVFLISDGVMVNGDELVNALNNYFPQDVLITGGLAADKGRFTQTLVGLNGIPVNGKIVAVGFYGKELLVGHGSFGGWDEFGPIRRVTKSKGNVLFELDQQDALQLYKTYLGPKKEQLPQSALLFPLSVKKPNEEGTLVRTILSINEDDGSMVFAGDIPEGSEVRFMMANFDKLIDGASEAARTSMSMQDENPSCVVMISCIGRKIVLDQRVEEEVESVKDIFGSDVVYNGFYSNGEISPLVANAKCSLHNQTMTITTYNEL